jgi:cytochrome c-type biogenesis protein CcmF
MEEIQYIGELLLPRQLGHLAIVGSFVAALLATIAYIMATRHQNRLAIEANAEGKSNSVVIQPNGEGDRWQRLGRIAFLTHGLLLLLAIGCIFYVMLTRRYEYFYAHSHTNPDLSMRYVFAAFWEGQEGSFSLWLFWHFILGGVLIWRTGGTWERPTMAVLGLIQVFLGSMILGLHFGFGDWVVKWGSNPTLLLRETMGDIPLFRKPNYVDELSKSAKGLSPLLQNYWMTIHPPTLFLGFASTAIPFCFAIAGLWTKRYTEWLRMAMPYVLFSSAILGLGILMGGAWAYEALSFNGYWAWDPVENMSLVPWLTLVAGLHTHLVARATGQSIRATAIFYILTFLLILYSTFLTRSGILGDTSAHAFTEMGLTSQLVIFQAFFLFLAGYFLIKRYKEIPSPAREESVSSREFWMFMGSLVLLMSVVLMSFTTSIPVYNKVFELFGTKTKFTSPVDAAEHHNSFQLWIAVSLGFLSGGAQYLRFRAQGLGKYAKNVLTHLVAATAVTAVFTFLLKHYWIEANAWQYVLMLFAGVFTVVTNVDYLITFMRGNLKAAGSAFSHIGLGVLIVGILASGLNKNWISKNRFLMEGMGFKGKELEKNIVIHKGKKTPMSGFDVTYVADSATGLRRDFTIKLEPRDENGNNFGEPIVVHPYILYDRRTQKVASTNPDTKHYLTYDIFSHISALPPEEQDPKDAKKMEDTLKYKPYEAFLGEKITMEATPQYSAVEIEFLGLDKDPTHPKYVKQKDDVALGLKLKLRALKNDSMFFAMPVVLFRDKKISILPTTVNGTGLRLRLNPEVFTRLMNQSVTFKDFSVKQGETIEFEGTKIKIGTPTPNPTLKNFNKEPNDMAFGVSMELETADGKKMEAEPDMIIRGGQLMPLEDIIEAANLRLVIKKIDPEKGVFTIGVASTKAPEGFKIPLDVAQNVPLSDYLVLEATINPGINLVWLGCLMMLGGFVISLVFRLRSKL